MCSAHKRADHTCLEMFTLLRFVRLRMASSVPGRPRRGVAASSGVFKTTACGRGMWLRGCVATMIRLQRGEKNACAAYLAGRTWSGGTRKWRAMARRYQRDGSVTVSECGTMGDVVASMLARSPLRSCNGERGDARRATGATGLWAFCRVSVDRRAWRRLFTSHFSGAGGRLEYFLGEASRLNRTQSCKI